MLPSRMLLMRMVLQAHVKLALPYDARAWSLMILMMLLRTTYMMVDMARPMMLVLMIV